TGETLDVIARDASEIWAGAGNVAGTKGSAAIGAGVAFNATIDEDDPAQPKRGTHALVENAEVDLNGALTLDAYSDSAIRAIAVYGTGSDKIAIGGSLTSNLTHDSVTASIADSAVEAGSASVVARDREDAPGDRASIWSLAGNVTG